MYNKTFNINKKRLYTQTITKTQLALQAIKRHDQQQSRANIIANNSRALLDDLDYQYTRLNKHKVVELDRNYKVNLLSYGQEYYCLEMDNYIFPMRVSIKNVRNEGIMFIGYDNPYPGIASKNKNKNIYQQSQQQLIQKPEYDSKIVVNKDMLITLKNKGNRTVKNVYFSVTTSSSLLMFDFRVQFLGFVRENRVKSQVLLKKSQNIGSSSELMPTLIRNKTEMISGQKQQERTFFKRSGNNKNQLLTILSKQQLKKHDSRPNLMPDLLNSPQKASKSTMIGFNQTKLKSLSTIKATRGRFTTQHSEVDAKNQQVKLNRLMFEQYKQKDRQLRQMASQCKIMISQHQKAYNKQNIRRRKMNRDIVLWMYSAIFIVNTINQTNNKIRKNNISYKVDYLCRKFIRKLKKKHQQSVDLIPTISRRIRVQEVSGIAMMSKIIYKNSINKACELLGNTLQILRPSLTLNKLFVNSFSYRNKIRLIQKQWKSKYHNRIKALLFFMDIHIQKMTRQHPQLKIFKDNFYKTGVNKKLCVQYVKDQSQKYRYIYEAYLHELTQIQEITKVAVQMAFENNKKDKQKQKGHKIVQKSLVIPKRPTRPVHRFYRNLDILKSMVRTWFEIQFKKYAKKSNKSL